MNSATDRSTIFDTEKYIAFLSWAWHLCPALPLTSSEQLREHHDSDPWVHSDDALANGCSLRHAHAENMTVNTVAFHYDAG